MMPVMDGWEFVARCQRVMSTSVPIIVVSATHEPERTAAGLRANGVRAVLPKPFDADALISIIAHYAPPAA